MFIHLICSDIPETSKPKIIDTFPHDYLGLNRVEHSSVSRRKLLS